MSSMSYSRHFYRFIFVTSGPTRIPVGVISEMLIIVDILFSKAGDRDLFRKG